MGPDFYVTCYKEAHSKNINDENAVVFLDLDCATFGLPSSTVRESFNNCLVTIQSHPPANGSLVQTELENTVSLTCVVDTTAGGVELEWYRNGRLVSLRDGNRQKQSSLCVEPVTRDDNGAIFTCQIMANASVNTSIQLEVNYGPVLNDSEDVWLEEQSDVVLSCDVRAHPPVTVVWKKADKLLDLSTGGYWSSNNGITAQLTISNAKRDVHHGLYTCETTSSVYGVMSKTFVVIVTDKMMKFPLGPTIAGLVVVFFTALLAVISRWQKITKCFR
ncbi:transmembrane and immunoglobulin domain-containing protein 1 [Brachyhypopomus gauderio]|uniref:transmembrane and immunoglobulin domain-containing protein 1 n=1 Tax=Brachyhypopomus gauderio TaxID=698409 RepID=UPI0040419321